jgi:flagellar hook-basal body complex protein FliE
MRTEMDLAFAKINGLDGAERAIEHSPKSPNAAAFTGELDRAIGEVDKLQVEADQQATQVAAGGGNLHEMALALEKADVGMRLAVRVRNKVVETYNEIMRMGV